MTTTLHFPKTSPAFGQALRQLAGKAVAVYGHLRPDGDCIGSQVALARVLRTLGADAICVNHHEVPPACASFVGDTPFFQDSPERLAGRILVSVDCADPKRLGPVFAESGQSVHLNVDHHISNTNYAAHNFIEPTSAATGEILAGYFLDNDFPIDAVTAQGLYVGIATDTGQFRFSSTTATTFDLACQLIARGADPAAAAHALYENESPEKLALLQRFLASFRYVCNGRVCIGTLTEKDWAETRARKEDTEGLVDYARSITGIDIGVLIEEREGQIKGSFRAKDPIMRVDQLAKSFNGGGHACAAGFNPTGTLAEVQTRLEEALGRHLAAIDKNSPEQTEAV